MGKCLVSEGPPMPRIDDSAVLPLIDYLCGQCVQALEEVLEHVASAMGIRHIAYVHFAAHSDARIIDTIVTYPTDWQIRYAQQSYFRIDPVLTTGCERVTPFDWDEIRTGDSDIAAFFDDAVMFGIGRKGISVPIRNRAGGCALASFTSDHSEGEWAEFKRENMTALQSIAAIIDSAATFTRMSPPFPAALSKLEKRLLGVFARKPNVNDVADEVGVSPGVVTLYLDTARHKLRCLSVRQAVSIAIATESISPDIFL